MQVLPLMPKMIDSKITSIISDFIWNARKPKIRTSELQMLVENGGVKLANMVARDKSLKIEWVSRLHSEHTDQAMRSVVFKLIGSKLINELFWECNLSAEYAKQFGCKSPFWTSVMIAWSELNFENPETEAKIANQILWYNSLIRIANKPVFFEKWYSIGIIYLKDLMVGKNIVTYEQLKCKYDNSIDVMDYKAIITAIPSRWKKVVQNIDDSDIECQSLYGQMSSMTKWSSKAYHMYIKTFNCIDRVQARLHNVLKKTITQDEIVEAFISIKKYMTVTKYRAFQYRLLHNTILLNDRLIHLSISSTNICSQCHKEKETVSHFFFECDITQRLLNESLIYIAKFDHNQKDLHVEMKNVILGTVTEDPYSFVNLFFVVLKQKLYACKCLKTKISFEAIKNEFEFIERKEAITSGKVIKYNRKWPDKIQTKDENLSDNLFVQIYLQHALDE